MVGLSKELEEADLDVKVDGTFLAFDSFINDPTQSSYAKVYVDTLKSAVISIVSDYERDIAFLNERIDELEKKNVDLYLDQMGK